MNDRRSERGEGRIGFFLSIALLAMAIFVGVKIIPVRINAYQFRDFVEQQCRFGATRYKDEEILKSIYAKAKELRLPLDQKNVHMERTMNEMIISAKYEQTIDLKFTKYVYKYQQEEHAPLF